MQEMEVINNLERSGWWYQYYERYHCVYEKTEMVYNEGSKYVNLWR